MVVFADKDAFMTLGLEEVISPRVYATAKDCIICLEHLDIRPSGNLIDNRSPHLAVRIFDCKHVMGKECLDAWLSVGSSCPECMKILFEPPKDSNIISTREANQILHALSPRYGEQRVLLALLRLQRRREQSAQNYQTYNLQRMKNKFGPYESRNEDASLAEHDVWEMIQEYGKEEDDDNDSDMEGLDDEDPDDSGEEDMEPESEDCGSEEVNDNKQSEYDVESHAEDSMSP